MNANQSNRRGAKHSQDSPHKIWKKAQQSLLSINFIKFKCVLVWKYMTWQECDAFMQLCLTRESPRIIFKDIFGILYRLKWCYYCSTPDVCSDDVWSVFRSSLWVSTVEAGGRCEGSPSKGTRNLRWKLGTISTGIQYAWIQDNKSVAKKNKRDYIMYN